MQLYLLVTETLPSAILFFHRQKHNFTVNGYLRNSEVDAATAELSPLVPIPSQARRIQRALVALRHGSLVLAQIAHPLLTKPKNTILLHKTTTGGSNRDQMSVGQYVVFNLKLCLFPHQIAFLIDHLAASLSCVLLLLSTGNNKKVIRVSPPGDFRLSLLWKQNFSRFTRETNDGAYIPAPLLLYTAALLHSRGTTRRHRAGPSNRKTTHHAKNNNPEDGGKCGNKALRAVHIPSRHSVCRWSSC